MKKRRKRRVNPGRCPCGSGEIYRNCCRPFHRKEMTAGTAEELMRSRYSAYARGEVEYVIETTDAEGEAWEEDRDKWRRSIKTFGETTQFLGVEILDESERGDEGEVFFFAKLRREGVDVSFRERSRFFRRKDRWLYHSGEFVEE